MRKCDSCGKVVVNEKEYMCPHCGAVVRKKCDHSTHLPDDKYNRANDYSPRDYRTTAEEHKSKTYDYEKAPRTDTSQKFDINDLANIKNAEDVKKIAKKAFIEQDKNGRKKFKPIAIVLIVIFAVNIFANLMSVAFDAVDTVFDELDSVFSEEIAVGEEPIIHSFTLHTYVDGATFDRENDCLTIDINEMYFEYYGSHDEYYEDDTDEWQSDFSSPGNYISNGDVSISFAIYDGKEVQNVGFDEYSYNDSIDLAAELSADGELKIYGLKTHLRNMVGKDVYCLITNSLINSANSETNESFECSFFFPFNYIKISADDKVSFYNIYEDYENEGKNVVDKLEVDERYVPDVFIEHVEFGSGNMIDESVPASVTYTETVTLVE